MKNAVFALVVVAAIGGAMLYLTQPDAGDEAHRDGTGQAGTRTESARAPADGEAPAEPPRYVTQEAFEAVKKGMTPDEVRQVLGAPRPANVKNYEDRGAVAWFYPTDDQGRAAAVYFQNRKNDGQKVYETDFEAVRPR